MTSTTSRAEALSMLLQKTISNENIRENVVIRVATDVSTKDLVFTFKDGTIKRIPRTSAGTSQASVVVVNTALINVAGELVITLSNNEVYNFGIVRRPEDFDNYVGEGLYVGGEDPLVFKPFLAGPGVNVNQNQVMFDNLGQVDETFDGYSFFLNTVLTGSAASGAWRHRPLNTIQNGIVGCSLAGSVITLPPGTYYAKGFTRAYRTAYHSCRLQDVTGAQTLLLGIPAYAQVADGYTAEPHPFMGGFFTLAVESQIRVEAYYSTSYSSHALSTNDVQLEIWKVAS